MKRTYIILTACMLLFASAPLFAQGAPPATPIDGGLSALLIAGGLYGAKKIRDHHKKNH